ncbi:pilus assembly protein [Mesorhizobium sp. AaZ16]|uniref:pilus assembly protein n=1 Tax=Mesorhizobium sp. AaZ16 TaxID=3402289 RepID=UPI00374EFFF2
MIRRFLQDTGGNYALATVLAMIPLIGALALAVDFSEMNRQQQVALNALDAAGIATARHIDSGASDAALIAYATDFFHANLGSVDPADTTLSVVLPNNEEGGGTLKLSARLNYQPYFFPAFAELIGKPGDQEIGFTAKSEIRLKNTLEVALALDNSGSMVELGTGSGQKRIDLLKLAAKQLVDTLAAQALMIKQVEKPVQFALVPFAASVNVGPENAGASWMDIEGLSPVHHENFDWSTLSDPAKTAEKIDGVWKKKGMGWGDEAGGLLSRFSLYKDMTVVTSHERVEGTKRFVCDSYRSDNTCRYGHYDYDYLDTYGPFASWQGCIEARPYPYNVSDAPATGGSNNTGIGVGNPATMFVPMFAPDEPGDHWKQNYDNQNEPTPSKPTTANSWWNDDPASSGEAAKQRNMAKYFVVRPNQAPALTKGTGPNYGCTTNPITPLTDVSVPEGLASIKAAIDLMAPNGGTNVPEGLAWGWRAVSGGEPFSQGRADAERGNDKVVIVLTDGANTYYTPSSLGYSDPVDSKSIYSSYGYLQPGYNGSGVGRLFLGTSSAVGQFDYSNSNYTKALNEQMATVCDKAKAGGIMVMTVALDLNAGTTSGANAIDALRKCSSDSRFHKDPADASKPAKLFWNTTGGNLAEAFKDIADELSNLRIVG